MLDWNMQSGRELFVVFAAQGGRGESGIMPRLWAGSEAGQPFQAPQFSWPPVPWKHRRISLCFKSQANKETWISFNPLSPVLGLWHSNKDWLISYPLGAWKSQSVVVQGCMFSFWFLWLLNRLGMCDKTKYKPFEWLRVLSLQLKWKGGISGKNNWNFKCTKWNITIFKVYFE